MEATLFLRAEDANYREDTAVVFWEILIQQTHGGPKDSRTIPGKAELEHSKDYFYQESQERMPWRQ